MSQRVRRAERRARQCKTRLGVQRTLDRTGECVVPPDTVLRIGKPIDLPDGATLVLDRVEIEYLGSRGAA